MNTEAHADARLAAASMQGYGMAQSHLPASGLPFGRDRHWLMEVLGQAHHACCAMQGLVKTQEPAGKWSVDDPKYIRIAARRCAAVSGTLCVQLMMLKCRIGLIAQDGSGSHAQHRYVVQ